MDEVPSEADVERLVATWESVAEQSTVVRMFSRWWRAHQRPAEPTNLPEGESLLRDEQGLAVFRRPEPRDRWLNRHGVVCIIPGHPDHTYFGGRRFILAAYKPSTAERIAADVQAGITRYGLLAAADMGEVTRTVTNVLVERGYKHPEET